MNITTTFKAPKNMTPRQDAKWHDLTDAIKTAERNLDALYAADRKLDDQRERELLAIEAKYRKLEKAIEKQIDAADAEVQKLTEKLDDLEDKIAGF